jgi:hypothetical protein
VRQVGPFDVRLDRQPVVWLVRNLPCRDFRDHLAVRQGPIGTDLGLDTASLLASNQATFVGWGGTQRQWQFLQELKGELASGHLDLALPSTLGQSTRWSERLGQILSAYESTILPRFCFYCWGQLDSWPHGDMALAETVCQLWSAGGRDGTTPADACHDVPRAMDAITDSWSPFRSVAAWYVERYALQSVGR